MMSLLRHGAAALCTFLVFCMPALAQNSTPVEAFIAREKLQHSFRPLAGLFREELSHASPSVDSYVYKASSLRLDTDALNHLMTTGYKGIRLSLPDGEGGIFELDLARFNILSQGFTLKASGQNGAVTVPYVPGLFYRGVIDNIPGSLAAFSFFNNELYGVFSIPGKGNFSVTPNTMLGDTKEHYLLYNDADLKVIRRQQACLSSEPEMPGREEGPLAARLTYNNCRDVEVMLQADYATYLSRGSSVTDVTNYLTSVFNVMSVLYRNEGIYTSIKAVNVNTVSDDYQSLTNSSLAFLTKFGQLTQNNMGGADLAHLVSTRYGGTLGGVAWLDVLCEGYLGPVQHAGPYAFSNIYANETAGTFPTYTWNVECMTHEMGHNLGSPHTHNCIAWSGGAIDGCAPTVNAAYTEDGPCATGPIPSAAVKGTIMSYCHLLSGVGINFSNGFGPQPGDLIRNRVSTGACAANYLPDTVLTVAGTTLMATRECTDEAGLTFYWNDNETADESDDRLVLKLKKGSNDIGTLDSTGFAVTTVTLPAYGGNTGTPVSFPGGMAGGPAAAMNRYWNVTPVAQPSGTVEVYFPFSQQDISDIGGSIAGISSYTDLRFYKMGTGVDPDPAGGFTGATTANTTIYTYSPTTAGTATWTYAVSGNTRFARFLVSSFSGGGGFGANTAPLPLSLLWFRGEAAGGAVSLGWEVMQEQGIKEYLVERSADALHYEPLSIVAAQNLEQHRYNTMDYTPRQGSNYYRLWARNNDGTQQVAGMTQVWLRQEAGMNIYPNPAAEELHITLTGRVSGQGRLELLDVNGRVLSKTILDKADNALNVRAFAKGVYFLRLTLDGTTIHQKLLIQK